jgi:hypothetical protein
VIIGNSRRYDRLRPMCGMSGKDTMKHSYRNLGQVYGSGQINLRWMAFMTASRRL